jgi:hypothetical protein
MIIAYVQLLRPISPASKTLMSNKILYQFFLMSLHYVHQIQIQEFWLREKDSYYPIETQFTEELNKSLIGFESVFFNT